MRQMQNQSFGTQNLELQDQTKSNIDQNLL